MFVVFGYDEFNECDVEVYEGTLDECMAYLEYAIEEFGGCFAVVDVDGDVVYRYRD